MKIGFVASLIRNSLCIIYVFLLFFQKSLFTENYFLIAAINLATRGPLYTCLVLIFASSWSTKVTSWNFDNNSWGVERGAKSPFCLGFSLYLEKHVVKFLYYLYLSRAKYLQTLHESYLCMLVEATTINRYLVITMPIILVSHTWELQRNCSNIL